jgi:hypothetical protein
MAANVWTQEAQTTSLETANNNGKWWSQREIDTLFDLYQDGFSLSQIAEALERTYYSVSNMHRLGHKAASEQYSAVLSCRPSTKRVLPYDEPRTSFTSEEW